MFVPTTSALTPGAGDTTNTNTTNSTDNTTTISTTTTSNMNALSMFLFWFFIVSTAVLVIGSLAALRWLKRREKKVLEEHKAKSQMAAAKGSTDAGEAGDCSIGGSTVCLVPITASHTGKRETV